MQIGHVLLLSAIEGATEFLPVSSTGHLILASRLLALPPTDFLKSFEIFIQLGAIAAIAVLYINRLVTNWKLIRPLGVAFLPTAVAGAVFYPLIKGYLLESTTITIAALFVGGIALIFLERWYKPQDATRIPLAHLNLPKALVVGLAQALAIVPGVSRAAATIVGGLAVGLNRTEAVEFSFLLALPTMAAATGYDLYKTGFVFSRQEYLFLAIGFVVSFGSAATAVLLFRQFVKTHSFTAFGIYRIIIAVLLAFLLT